MPRPGLPNVHLYAAIDADRTTTIRLDAGRLLKASLTARQSTGPAARPTSKASNSASSGTRVGLGSAKE